MISAYSKSEEYLPEMTAGAANESSSYSFNNDL